MDYVKIYEHRVTETKGETKKRDPSREKPVINKSSGSMLEQKKTTIFEKVFDSIVKP